MYEKFGPPGQTGFSPEKNMQLHGMNNKNQPNA